MIDKEISGHTALYGIVADPITHVQTPQKMNRLFEEKGQDGVMVPFHVSTQDFEHFITSMRCLENLKGMIVTVPHKNDMVSYCDHLFGDAKYIGAVNTVHRMADGRLRGAMFDGLGFVSGLLSRGHEIMGKNVALLGAGGAAKAIAFSLANEGAARLHIVNRTMEKAEELSAQIAGRYSDFQVLAGEPDWKHVDLIVNATSLGLHVGDPMPLDPSVLHSEMLVAEIIMDPTETELMRVAKKAGCHVHAGRHMLEKQLELMAEFMATGEIR